LSGDNPYAAQIQSRWKEGAAKISATIKGILDDVKDAQTKAATERFKLVGADFILDQKTGLKWSATEVAVPQMFKNLEAKCRSSTFGGISGWRLPTRPEVESLIDPARQAFIDTPDSRFWGGIKTATTSTVARRVDGDIFYTMPIALKKLLVVNATVPPKGGG
jgi:Protein of unknown function (DUF1566)